MDTMRITVIAESRRQLLPVQEAVTAAGYDLLDSYTFDCSIECKSQEQCDAYILVCESVNQRISDAITTISDHCCVPVLLVTDDTSEQSVDAALHAGASVYLCGNQDLDRLGFLMVIARARHRQQQALLSELKHARNALEQRKVVEKAKGIVMKQRCVDEDTAYRAIRKLAMDNNKKLHEVASQIITAAEVLI